MVQSKPELLWKNAPRIIDNKSKWQAQIWEYGFREAEDRVYSIEELESMDERTKSKVWDNQVKHFSEGNCGVPYESHLKEAAKNGDLIYVKSYTRSDGTVVSGYYRKRR